VGPATARRRSILARYRLSAGKNRENAECMVQSAEYKISDKDAIPHHTIARKSVIPAIYFLAISNLL
jgi:hypothetical protein